MPPGVDHAMFSPGDRRRRRAPSLGLDAATASCSSSAASSRSRAPTSPFVRWPSSTIPSATLLLVGGPSGPDGDGELARLPRARRRARARRRRCGSSRRNPTTALADFYRAADVCLVPSRTESFGLVALEAAACGTPVVAASVGGLRSLVDDGATGFLVDGRRPADYAAPVALLLDDPELAARDGRERRGASRRYAWSITAARLRRLYGDLVVRGPSAALQ